MLPHTYEAAGLGDFPGTGKFGVPLVYIPPPQNKPEHAGLWVKVKAANGTEWIGVFAFGLPSSSSFSRVLASPDPERVCVIAEGSAYIVKADDPRGWEKIPVDPVRDVRVIPEQRLLVFSDFTRLAAYGPGGLLWRSPNVCWDELKIVQVTHETIVGTGYDPTNSITHESRFVIDSKTGQSLLPSPFPIGRKIP